MAYQPQVWIDDETEIDEVHMTHIEEGIKNAYNVSLIAISNTAPSECSTGDKYYNTTTKKIYVATATDTWSVEGETPLEDIFYVLFDDNTTYAWDGEDLISVGGGSGGSDDIVVIGDESDTTEDTKILIDTSEEEITLKHKDENLNTFVDTLSDYVNKKIEQAKAKDFVMVINNQNQTMVNDNTIYKYNINEVYSSYGSALTLDTTNHEIVIGAGVSSIMVAGMLYSFTRGANSAKQVYIYKNGVQVGRSGYAVNDDYINLILPVYIFTVSTGDRISVHVRSSGNGSNSTVWGEGTSGLSFITVKTI